MLQQRWLQGLFAILYCIIIFSFMLGERPLSSPDETRYTSISIEMNRTHNYVTPNINGIKFLDKPILFYWLQATCIHYLGLHHWVYRLVPAFFGALACVGVFFFALNYWGISTAWLALLVLSTSPVYFISARYVNMDMAIASLITLCLLCFHSAVLTASTRKRKLFVYSMYVFAGLGFLMKGLIGFTLPGLVIVLWMLIHKKWSILKWGLSPIGIGLFVLIIAPWLIAVQIANPNFFHYFFIFEQFNRFTENGFNNVMPWWFYLAVVFFGMLPWSVFIIEALFYGFKSSRYKNLDQNQTFWICWIIAILVFFSIPDSKIVTYILPVFAPIALLTAQFILHVNKEKSLAKMLLLISCISYFLTAFLILISTWFLSYYPILLGFKRYLYISSSILLAAAVINYIFYRKNAWLKQIMASAVIMLLLLGVASSSLIQWPRTDLSIIGNVLRTIIKPSDKLAAYQTYPFELPVILNKRIIVVANWNTISITQDNWKGHFQYGATPQDKKHWLLTPAEFWKLWNSPERVYLVISKNEYQLLQHSNMGLQNTILVAMSNDLLLVNHFPKISFIPNCEWKS